MKKICSICKIKKDVDDFHIRKELGPNGRRSSCKLCRNKKRQKYAKDNVEKENNRIKKWRKENPDKKLKADREWRNKNPDKVRAADKKWKSENREKLSAQKAKRRALFVGIKENFGEDKRKCTFDRFKNKCFNCGSTKNLTIDHHTVISRICFG